MSKTFYADGQTGKVAIMEGDLDMGIVNNPVVNSDKLYFHTRFNYLQYIGSITNSAVFPQLLVTYGNPYASSQLDILVGTIAFPVGKIPIVFAKINSIESNGHFLVTGNPGGYNPFRVLLVRHELGNDTLSVYLKEAAVAVYPTNIAQYTANITIDIFTTEDDEEIGGLTVSPNYVSFGNRFYSNKKYLKQGAGYKLAQNNTLYVADQPQGAVSNTVYIYKEFTK